LIKYLDEKFNKIDNRFEALEKLTTLEQEFTMMKAQIKRLEERAMKLEIKIA